MHKVIPKIDSHCTKKKDENQSLQLAGRTWGVSTQVAAMTPYNHVLIEQSCIKCTCRNKHTHTCRKVNHTCEK